MSIEQNNSGRLSTGACALASHRFLASYGLTIVDWTQQPKKEVIGDSNNIDATIAPVGISRQDGRYCSSQGL